MNKNNNKLKSPQKRVESEIEKDLSGYPIYPDSEDIYENDKEERDLNPEENHQVVAMF